MDFLEEIKGFKELFKKGSYCKDISFVVKIKGSHKELLLWKDEMNKIRETWRWEDGDRLDLIENINDKIRVNKKMAELEEDARFGKQVRKELEQMK